MIQCQDMPKTAYLTPEQRKANEITYSREYNSRPEVKEARQAWSKTEKGRQSQKDADERRRAKKQGRESKAPPKKVPQTIEERRESIRLASLKFTEENPELVKARKKKWREDNWDIQYALQRQWIIDNPERYKELCLRANHKRRVRLESISGIDLGRWKETLEYFEYKCGYCRDWATCLDHIVPVAKGGTNDHGNLIPACKRCNSSKRHKDLKEWFATSRIAKEGMKRLWDYKPPPKEVKIRIPKTKKTA